MPEHFKPDTINRIVIAIITGALVVAGWLALNAGDRPCARYGPGQAWEIDGSLVPSIRCVEYGERGF